MSNQAGEIVYNHLKVYNIFSTSSFPNHKTVIILKSNVAIPCAAREGRPVLDECLGEGLQEKFIEEFR
jgi:hypothetical protein